MGLPPLEMAGLLAIIREDHLQDFVAVATNLLRRYRSDLDQPALTRLLQAMSATRMDTADQIYDGAAFLTGCGISDADQHLSGRISPGADSSAKVRGGQVFCFFK